MFSHPDDLGKLRMSSGWQSTLAISYPDEILPIAQSSGWHTAAAICHPDEIAKSSGWVKMTYYIVVDSRVWLFTTRGGPSALPYLSTGYLMNIAFMFDRNHRSSVASYKYECDSNNVYKMSAILSWPRCVNQQHVRRLLLYLHALLVGVVLEIIELGVVVDEWASVAVVDEWASVRGWAK